MKEFEVTIEEFAIVLEKHLERLKRDYNRLQDTSNNFFDWNRRIPQEKVQKMAEERYLKDNGLWNPKKDYITRKRIENNAAIERIEQGSTFVKVTNFIKYKELERTNEILNRDEQRIQKAERIILESSEAKRFIKDYSQEIYKNDPVFKEYIKLDREKHGIKADIDKLIDLSNKLNTAEPGKTIMYAGRIDDLGSLLIQVPLINKQLSENSVSIREFEETINLHLKKIGKIGEKDSEYQRTIDEVFEFSKTVVDDLIRDKELKIFKKEELLSEIEYKDNNNIINLKASLKVKTLQNEISTDKKGLSEFKIKASKAIDEGNWEQIPSEIRETITKTPEYRMLSNKLIQLRKEQSVLDNLKSLSSKITNKDQTIKVEGFYLNRAKIIDLEKIIVKQLKEFDNSKNNQRNIEK